jgi:hypothetical protein
MNSKAVLLGGAILLLLVGALAGYLYEVNSTPRTTATASTTTVSAISNAYDQVVSTYVNQLLMLNSKNASAFASRYESNATVEWKGYAQGFEGHGGLVGNYTGSKNITALLGVLVRGHVGNLLISNETQAIASDGSYWVVNSTFDFAGNSSIVGSFEGAIAAQDVYVHIGNSWLISRETWNFLNYNEQYPVGP